MYAMSDEKMKGCDRFMRSAIVVGATGLVGSILVKLLCESEEYVSVTAITRRPLDFKHPKLVVKVRSFDLLEEKDIDFAHEIFCCLGTTMKESVAVVPGDVFGESGEGHIRCSYASSIEELQEAVKRIKRFISTLV